MQEHNFFCSIPFTYSEKHGIVSVDTIQDVFL